MLEVRCCSQMYQLLWQNRWQCNLKEEGLTVRGDMVQRGEEVQRQENEATACSAPVVESRETGAGAHLLDSFSLFTSSKAPA